MAEKSAGLNEPINVTVMTSVNPTGMNETIDLLKSFEKQLDILSQKISGLGGVKPAAQLKALQTQIQEFQKKGGGLTARELFKEFAPHLDTKGIERELGVFRQTMADEGKKAGDVFSSSIRKSASLLDTPIASSKLAARLIQPTVARTADATEMLLEMSRVKSSPAFPTPQQVAQTTIQQPPQKVTISRVEPEALPKPPLEQPIPKSVVGPAAIKKATTIGKGSTRINVQFENELDKAAYLANKLTSQAITDWAKQTYDVAADEFRAHGHRISKLITRQSKSMKKGGTLTIPKQIQTFTPPLPIPPPITTESALAGGFMSNYMEREIQARAAKEGAATPPPVAPPTETPTPPSAARPSVPEPTPPLVPPLVAAEAPPTPPPPTPPPVATVAPAGGEGEPRVRLVVQGSQIIAELVGEVRLVVPGTSIRAMVEGPVQAAVPGPAGVPAAPGAAGAPTPPVAPTPAAPPGEPAPTGRRRRPAAETGEGEPTREPTEIPVSSNELERTIIESGEKSITKITEALEPGSRLTTTYSAEDEVKSKVTRTRTGLRTPEEKFNYEIEQALKDELASIRSLTTQMKAAGGTKIPENLERIAQESRKSGTRLIEKLDESSEAFVGSISEPERQETMRERIVEPKSADVQRRINQLNTEANALESQAAALRRAQAQKQHDLEARVAKTNNRAAEKAERNAAARQRIRDREAEDLRRLNEALRTQEEIGIRVQFAQRLIQETPTQGFKPVGGVRTGFDARRGVSWETRSFEKEEGGNIVRRDIKMEQDRQGRYTNATFQEVPRKAPISSRGSDTLEYIGYKFKALATYAGEAMILYGALEEARKAMESMIRTSLETAKLSQVFKGVGGSARDLINDVIRLSSMEGVSAQQAEASAVSWARLGLTRREVGEAVRVSLQASNIADVEVATATEHLQTVMAAYGLQVKDLEGILGAVNTVSQQYKVTQSQLFDALSRTAAVAKQTGLPFEELNGLLGVTIAKTGQTGVAVGNTVATLMASLSRPDIQKFLREEFKLELTVAGGAEVQSMSDRLQTLYTAYQKMNRIQRENLASHLLGARQITRLTALFDAYMESQVAGVNSQLRLNSAEETSAKIRATLHSRLIGLRSEMERFWAVTDQKSGFTATLADMAEGASNFLRIIEGIADVPKMLEAQVPVNKNLQEAISGKNADLLPKYEPKSPLFETLKMAAEAFGASNGQAEKQVASFDRTIRDSGGAMKAYAGAVQVYKVAMDSFLQGTTKERMDRLEQFSKLETLKNPDQTKAELAIAVRAKNQPEINRILEQQIEFARQRQADESDRQMKAIANRKGAIQVEIKRLEGSSFGKTTSGQKQIQDWQKQLADSGKALLQVWDDQQGILERNEAALSQMVATDIRHLTFLESQKMTLQAIAETYRSISKTTPLEEHFANISGLQYSVDAIKTALDKVEAEYEKSAEIASNIKERGGTPNEYGTPLPRLEEERKQLREQLRQRQGELNAERANALNAAALSRGLIAREIAGSEARAFEFGDLEIDRLKRRHAALTAMTEARKEVIANPQTPEMERNAALVMQAQQLSDLTRTRLELEKSRLTVMQHEYEFNKKLLMSGPEELLQRIVAQRMASSGRPVSATQFMALSPGMREKVIEASEVERGRRFAAETPAMAERMRWINEPATEEARVYEQIRQAQPIKPIPVESTFGGVIQSQAVTVQGTTVTVMGTGTGNLTPGGREIFAALQQGKESMPGVPPQDWAQLRSMFGKGEIVGAKPEANAPRTETKIPTPPGQVIVTPPEVAPATPKRSEGTTAPITITTETGATHPAVPATTPKPAAIPGEPIVPIAEPTAEAVPEAQAKSEQRPAGMVAWDIANRPALTYLPKSWHDFLMHKESGKRISQATGLPRVMTDTFAGGLNAAAETSERMTAPINLATAALWPFKLAKLAFAGQALVDLKSKFGEGKEAYKQGDYQGMIEAIAGGLIDVLMVGGAAHGYKGGKGPGAGEIFGGIKKTGRELLVPETQPKAEIVTGEEPRTRTIFKLATPEVELPPVKLAATEPAPTIVQQNVGTIGMKPIEQPAATAKPAGSGTKPPVIETTMAIPETKAPSVQTRAISFESWKAEQIKAGKMAPVTEGGFPDWERAWEEHETPKPRSTFLEWEQANPNPIAISPEELKLRILENTFQSPQTQAQSAAPAPRPIAPRTATEAAAKPPATEFHSPLISAEGVTKRTPETTRPSTVNAVQSLRESYTQEEIANAFSKYQRERFGIDVEAMHPAAKATQFALFAKDVQKGEARALESFGTPQTTSYELRSAKLGIPAIVAGSTFLGTRTEAATADSRQDAILRLSNQLNERLAKYAKTTPGGDQSKRLEEEIEGLVSDIANIRRGIKVPTPVATVAIPGTAPTTTLSAAQPAKPIQAPTGTKTESAQIDEAVQEVVQKSRITVAAEPTVRGSESIDGTVLNNANLALAQFTTGLNDSSNALSAFRDTLGALEESVSGLAGEIDDVSSKLSEMVPEQNGGPPKIQFAE